MDRSSPTLVLAREQSVGSRTMVSSFDSKELDVLQQQIGQGDFTGLRQVLVSMRQDRDWQDRYFVLDVVAAFIVPDPLDKMREAESNAADLSLIRGVYFFNLVGKSRGTKTADRTTDQQFLGAQHHAKASIASLQKACQLDTADPTPHVFAMRSFQVFSSFHTHLRQAYQQAIRLAPDFVPAHFAMVNAQSKKWGGSQEKSLRVARQAAANAQPGSDAPACIFLAHILAWQHLILFDKDRKGADAYTKDHKVNQELNEAFDHWVRPSYQSRLSSVPYLHHAAYWYYQAGDRGRLQQALAAARGKSWNKAWAFVGDGDKTYSAAAAFAASGTKNESIQEGKKGGLFGWFR